MCSECAMKKKRGFALLSKERMKAIARKGGIQAQRLGTGHRWNTEEAKRAGHKGGLWKRKKK